MAQKRTHTTNITPHTAVMTQACGYIRPFFVFFGMRHLGRSGDTSGVLGYSTAGCLIPTRIAWYVFHTGCESALGCSMSQCICAYGTNRWMGLSCEYFIPANGYAHDMIQWLNDDWIWFLELGFGIWRFGFGIWEFGLVWGFGLGIWALGFRICLMDSGFWFSG